MRFARREGFRGGGFRSGGFRERDDIPKPVNVGEEYDVEINEIGSRGDGIARVKNFVVFVNNVKQGEKVKIKIKEVRNRFAIGEKVSESEEGTEEKEETTEKEEETKEMTDEEEQEEESGEETTEEEEV